MSYPPAGTQRHTGTCFEVIDGATMNVRHADGTTATLRLERVRVPELRQPGGPPAKRLLESLVLDRQVTFAVEDRDRHGRLLAEVWVGTVNVNDRMREAGYR
ncbi:MAG: thermonuclease family protein [Planctomycetota bacterium]|jgi:endonuclease YncB( thermonuclease family)